MLFECHSDRCLFIDRNENPAFVKNTYNSAGGQKSWSIQKGCGGEECKNCDVLLPKCNIGSRDLLLLKVNYFVVWFKLIQTETGKFK